MFSIQIPNHSAVQRPRAFPGRQIAAVALMATFGLAATACSGGPSPSGLSKDDQLKIGVSVAALDSPFFGVMIDNVRSAAENEGASVVQVTNAARDPGQQVTDIRNLITAGANSIIVSVVDPKAIQPALDYAASKKVPVVVVDDLPAAGNLYEAVKSDNYEMGATAADKMAELLPSGGLVANITGSIETTNGRDRAAGFTDTIADKYPNIQVIEKNAEWDGPTSGNVANALLSANPNINGIYLASDTLYYEPVASALKGRGLLHPVGDPKHIPIIGVDGGAYALSQIREGMLDGTVSQPAGQYGQEAVKALVSAQQGIEPTPGPTDHNSVIEKVNDYYVDLLTAPLVTTANANDPSLWGNAGETK